jgi:alpha-L-fucosidase
VGRPWTKYGEGPAADAAAAAMVAIRKAGFAGRANEKNQGDANVGGGGQPRRGYTPQDVRFTTNGDTLYAILMSRPKETAVIHSLGSGAGKIEKIELLGHGPVSFTQDAAGLNVTLPAEAPGQTTLALKITGLRLGSSKPAQ